jgi:tryptophanyl-tRNA synthetase
VPEGGTLVGTDGQAKMSKSLNNTILLSDDAKTVETKVRAMYTDPARIRADIPGKVEGNPVFIYHDIFNPDKPEVNDLKDRYRTGNVGDVEVKKKLAIAINNFLEPMRERRAVYETKPRLVDEILQAGNAKTRKIAQETVRMMDEAMGLLYFKD